MGAGLWRGSGAGARGTSQPACVRSGQEAWRGATIARKRIRVVRSDFPANGPCNMSVPIPLHRQILALTDEQLEQFVREWISHKKEYVEVERLTGPGDMGRDVVGYLTKKRSEGPWHNYQCKQYG